MPNMLSNLNFDLIFAKRKTITDVNQIFQQNPKQNHTAEVSVSHFLHSNRFNFWKECSHLTRMQLGKKLCHLEALCNETYPQNKQGKFHSITIANWSNQVVPN